MKACSVCGSGSDPRAVTCWVCGGAIVDAAPRSTPRGPLPGQRSPTSARPSGARSGASKSEGEKDGDTFLRVFGWMTIIVGIGFVSLLVGVELAIEWPGLLIPYALIQLVVFTAIGRTAYVHIKRAREGPPTKRDDDSIVSAKDVVQGAALAVTVVTVVVALLILLLVAAVVLFMMVCFAVIAVSGGFH